MTNPLRTHLSLVELLLETEQRLRQMLKRYATKVKPRLERELPELQQEVEAVLGDTIEEKAINYIKDADPTPEGTYTEWLVTRWLAGAYSLEDLKVLSDNLRVFNNKRAQIAIKDIQRYRTPQDLAAAVRPFIKVDGKLPDHFRGREDEIEGDDHSIILRDDSDWLVVQPKTTEAAQYWGCHTGTNGQPWCIAWGIPRTKQQNAKSQFLSYTQAGRFPFILVFDKRGQQSFRDGGAYAIRLAAEAPVLTLKENGPEIDAVPYLTGELAPIMQGKFADIIYGRYPWMKPEFFIKGDPTEIIKWVKEKPKRFLPLLLQSGRLDSMSIQVTSGYKVYIGELGDQAIVYGTSKTYARDEPHVYLGHVDAENRAEMKLRPYTFQPDDLVTFFRKTGFAPATFAMEGFCLTKGVVWDGRKWARIKDLGTPIELPFIEQSRVYQLGSRPFYAIDTDPPMLATVKGTKLELLDGPPRDNAILLGGGSFAENLRGLIALVGRDKRITKVTLNGAEQRDGNRFANMGILAIPNRPLAADPSVIMDQLQAIPDIAFHTGETTVLVKEVVHEVFSGQPEEMKQRLMRILKPKEPYKLISEGTTETSGVKVERVGVYLPDVYFETGWSLFGEKFAEDEYTACVRAATAAAQNVQPPQMASLPIWAASYTGQGNRRVPGVSELQDTIRASMERAKEYASEQAKANAGGNSVFAKMAMRNIARKMGE